MTAAAQVESAPSEGGSKCFDGTAVGHLLITAEIAHAESVSLSGEDPKKPEGRNRRAEQNRRSSQKEKNRKRKAQENVGAMSTHEAEGTKTRGAVETSYEITHDPDPLCPTVAGVDKKLASAMTGRGASTYHNANAKKVQIAPVEKMGAAKNSDFITQAGFEKAGVGNAELARIEAGFSDEEPSSAVDPYARPRGSKSARIGGAEMNFEITIPAAPVTFNVLIPGDVDPRDKMLAGPKPSATFENTESIGTTASEPQAVPEKKMRRADGVTLVENEDKTNAITSGLDSGEMKLRAIRSDEARARKNAKRNQRRRAWKASSNNSQNMTETESAQEAEETERLGKWEGSSEISHGLN
jgi:hypothetical protein